MTTEQLLLLNCSKKENEQKINKAMWKIKPVAKILEKNGCSKDEKAPIELLEQALHGLCEHYPYRLQQIWTYCEDKQFKFYHLGIMHVTDTYEWLGDINGRTLWEVVAKAIIKIYVHIKELKKNE